MNKIVKEHYPIAKLPEDLRAGLDPGAEVTVIIEQEAPTPSEPMTLDEIFTARQPPYRTAEEIDRELRKSRDAWDG